MMIDIDEQLPLLYALHSTSESFQARAIRRDHAIELLTFFRRLDDFFGVKERQLGRDWILVPARYFLSCVDEREGQAKLRSDTITVGPHMTHHADRFNTFDGFDYTINDLGMNLH